MGLHGDPSLFISIFPVVYAQATRLLKTISVLNLGLAPKTVEGLNETTVNLSSESLFNSFSASHLASAYAVTGFFSLSYSSS